MGKMNANKGHRFDSIVTFMISSTSISLSNQTLLSVSFKDIIFIYFLRTVVIYGLIL